MNLSLMRNEMEIFFRVFFTSSCEFGRPKKVCGETVAGVFFQTLRSGGITDRRR